MNQKHNLLKRQANPVQPVEVAFTEREKAVAQAIYECNGVVKASRRLRISISTVKYHCTNIREKMGVDSTFKAVHKAQLKGLF